MVKVLIINLTTKVSHQNLYASLHPITFAKTFTN